MSAACLTANAQKTYETVLPAHNMTIKTNHLKVGDKNPQSELLTCNSYYFMRGGRPIFPICGEMQYGRYPREEWETELRKMKAGGITVVTTYVLWALHEEVEGKFVWTGNRDLRSFIKLCKQEGLECIVRMGPFCHAEFRNGGFPDWLYARPLEVRSNNKLYLKYSERFYGEIAKQMEGLYYKDGGPIIGVQIENEHQHSSGCWAIKYGEEAAEHTNASYDASIIMEGVSEQTQKISRADLGDLHMMTLKRIAESKGVKVPFFTATGWGNAAVLANEGIPVTACYPFPYWAKPSMSRKTMLTDLRRNMDYKPARYNLQDFPSMAAETGIGMEPVYQNRPRPMDYDAEATAHRNLGSGCNAFGYYPYHGGTTPHQIGGVGFFNDEPYGVPKMSYNWDAPLTEYGLENFSYRPLRLINTFARDFGDIVAPMEIIYPESQDSLPLNDHETLRYSVRTRILDSDPSLNTDSDGRTSSLIHSGFVFVSNYQDHDTTRIDWKNYTLRLTEQSATSKKAARGDEIETFTFNLRANQVAIMPFNLQLSDNVLLKKAIAQPLTHIGNHYFFFQIDDNEPVYTINGKTIHAKAGQTLKVKDIMITTLTREQAIDAMRIDNKLIITKATVVPSKNGSVQLLSLGSPNFEYTVWTGGKSKTYCRSVESVNSQVEVKKVAGQKWTCNVDKNIFNVGQVHDYFLTVDYIGDVAMMFTNGIMEGDNFYDGRHWNIAINRFRKQIEAGEPFVFHFRPVRYDASFLKLLPTEAKPDFKGKTKILNMRGITLTPQYKLQIDVL